MVIRSSIREGLHGSLVVYVTCPDLCTDGGDQGSVHQTDELLISGWHSQNIALSIPALGRVLVASGRHAES